VKSFALEIRTPEREVFLGRVVDLTVEAEDGKLGVLPDHAPLATMLAPGFIRYQLETGEEIKFQGESGFLIVKDNFASLLLKGLKN
jgi:F-type H+-transporting ATPase subunit epsilon